MRFSRALKSSPQCLPSPDGAYIATILPSKLSIRKTATLEIIRAISLPPELSASISWFLWSPSSARLLVASTDNIRVYSPSNSQFSANIKNPTSDTTKITFVAFGATDDEICVFSEFGIQLSVINLNTSKSVDILAPKLYHPAVAGKGFAYRPKTQNLALLTRSGGKDIISIHARDVSGVMRSWHPETVDAQGIAWSPDGKWLVVWESAAQGHRLFVYTADGHLFKVWNGPIPVLDEDGDIELGAGIKLFDWNRTGTHMAVGDYSRRVTILSVPSFVESMKILHPTAITPTETLQVWQEQVLLSQHGGFGRKFVRATQVLYPPTSSTPPNSNVDEKAGTNIMSFDNSGTLLATRTENMPTTIWIWDIGTKILRAVMIMHAPIARVTWHPSIGGVLMIRCENEDSRGLVHLWDPSWENPEIIDFAAQMGGNKVLGKTIARWLNTQSASPAMLFSDLHDYLLASISGSDDDDLPWQDGPTREFDIYGQRQESPLNLVPVNEKRGSHKISVDALMEDDGFTKMSSGSDEVEDTFQFRKFVE
ncbi:WD40-containing protein [Venustampulla echinocandica]|uniref:WD40-containing protein n=1 Tax=Venustampulla echinocandica TaxID=2656787 RepID=A0A370TV59_9HELO|nr:WD40-containing protein [Venustampulla echinocandica]RDL39390.1 WD40-containing protein [Venustampulla echinocandica]